MTGGGRHNPVIMEMIAAGLKCPVSPIEDAGLNGDMLEAQAFAYLAMRVACGLPTSCASTTGYLCQSEAVFSPIRTDFMHKTTVHNAALISKWERGFMQASFK